eukprot:TRINITY_DN8109_c0_g1_i1.p1 TRINITY_DN8109_c0_g1~~TRINITY_DN8109_c0_g1_i1.p1  ORF type:complete len:366 (-),score=67.74 TRINITY_DN8109_c0_g1_i1:58-1155(-)
MTQSKSFSRLPEAHPDGGYKFSDEEEIARQRGVVWDVLKQLGNNLTQGHNIINISLPVKIFEPRSYLERLVDAWCYAPIFLNKAAYSEDPVEKMKQVICFAIAGFSNTCGQRKPFNPILGETFQAHFEDGTEILCEQTSHHPPVSNWQLFGPDKCYHLHGYGEWTASFRGNYVKGQQKGVHVVDFKDGNTIKYLLPEVWVRGIVYGERVVEYDGVFHFRDKKNKLGCQIHINPPQEGTGFFFGWGATKKKNPSDYFTGTIFRIKGEDYDDLSARQTICTVEGSWVGQIDFDNTTYWDCETGLPKFQPIPVDDPLPSDCRFREDLKALQAGDYDEAAKWKAELENKQRNEARLRKLGADKRKGAQS